MSDNGQPTEVKLVWDSEAADELDLLYANQMFISQTKQDFVLVFGQATGPVTLEGQPSQIRVKPVARIALSPQAMQEFMETINKNWKRTHP